MQWAQSRRAGVILPGRHGGIRPHENFELSLEACLGCCLVDTRTGRVQASWARCSRQMDWLEQRPVSRHTLAPRNTHMLICPDASFSQELGRLEAICKVMSLCPPESAHSSKSYQPLGSNWPFLKRTFNVYHPLLSFPSMQAGFSLSPGWAYPLGSSLTTNRHESQEAGHELGQGLLVLMKLMPLLRPLANQLKGGGRKGVHSTADHWPGSSFVQYLKHCLGTVPMCSLPSIND